MKDFNQYLESKDGQRQYPLFRQNPLAGLDWFEENEERMDRQDYLYLRSKVMGYLYKKAKDLSESKLPLNYIQLSYLRNLQYEITYFLFSSLNTINDISMNKELNQELSDAKAYMNTYGRWMNELMTPGRHPHTDKYAERAKKWHSEAVALHGSLQNVLPRVANFDVKFKF